MYKMCLGLMHECVLGLIGIDLTYLDGPVQNIEFAVRGLAILSNGRIEYSSSESIFASLSKSETLKDTICFGRPFSRNKRFVTSDGLMPFGVELEIRPKLIQSILCANFQEIVSEDNAAEILMRTSDEVLKNVAFNVLVTIWNELLSTSPDCRKLLLNCPSLVRDLIANGCGQLEVTSFRYDVTMDLL